MTSKDIVNSVEQAVETLRQAMISGDRALLGRLTADELSYGHSGGHVETKSGFIDKLASGKVGWSAIELSDQTVTIIDNIAVVRHVFSGTSRDPPDGIVNKTMAVLSIWLQRHGQWTIVARQAVKIG